MKTIVVACGAGFASSTIITERLRELLAGEGLINEVRIHQCTFNEIPGIIESADCVVTSSIFSGDYDVPIFNGVAFLSGIGQEELEAKILELLK